MSREVRRVPLDFAWPLDEVWSGYLRPAELAEDPCPDCSEGLAPRAQHLADLWYGKAPFRPKTPLRPDTPAVFARAKSHLARAPGYYGTGTIALAREAVRLARLYNSCWRNHLEQEDVDALVAAGRLMEFTHTPTPDGWKKIEPAVAPTAEQVNAWTLTSMGHDDLNMDVVIRARCAREGVDFECGTCQGKATVEKYPGQRAEAQAWKPTDPPTGPGWQLWTTTTEGSPITPVFPDADGLIEYLCTEKGYRREAARTLVEQGSTAGTFISIDGALLHTATDADLIAAASTRQPGRQADQ